MRTQDTGQSELRHGQRAAAGGPTLDYGQEKQSRLQWALIRGPRNGAGAGLREAGVRTAERTARPGPSRQSAYVMPSKERSRGTTHLDSKAPHVWPRWRLAAVTQGSAAVGHGGATPAAHIPVAM